MLYSELNSQRQQRTEGDFAQQGADLCLERCVQTDTNLINNEQKECITRCSSLLAQSRIITTEAILNYLKKRQQ